MLKTIESLAFNFIDPDDLLELQQKLYGFKTEIEHKLPAKEGLILRPYLTSERARQVKLEYKALKSRLSTLQSYLRKSVDAPVRTQHTETEWEGKQQRLARYRRNYLYFTL